MPRTQRVMSHGAVVELISYHKLNEWCHAVLTLECVIHVRTQFNEIVSYLETFYKMFGKVSSKLTFVSFYKVRCYSTTLKFLVEFVTFRRLTTRSGCRILTFYRMFGKVSGKLTFVSFSKAGNLDDEPLTPHACSWIVLFCKKTELSAKLCL